MLDTFILKKARALLIGKVCSKVLLAGRIEYHSITNKRLGERIRLALADLELAIRRLKWAQEIAAHPVNNSHVLAAMFCTLKFENEPTLDQDSKHALDESVLFAEILGHNNCITICRHLPCLMITMILLGVFDYR